MNSAIASKTIDRISDIAQIINREGSLDVFTDEQLDTLSKIFLQLHTSIWKHRWNNRAAYRRSVNGGGSFTDA